MKSLPRKTLARDDIEDIKSLIEAVREMEKTVLEVGEQIKERFGEINER